MTPTSYDAAKALREELQGLADVERAIRQRERACEEAMGQAEVELNAVRKIRGYVRLQMETAAVKLAKLERDH